MKLFKEAKAQARRFQERRQSVVGSFNPFTRDIYQEKLLTPHQEMESCVKAYNNNSYFQSAVNTMTDFIIGGGIKVNSEDTTTKVRCEAYLKGLETNSWLREAIENTIKTGNGYAEIDFNPVTGLPAKVYPIADTSRIYLNTDMYGNPLMTTVMMTGPNGEQYSKEVPNTSEYFIQKLDYTQQTPKAKWYKLSYAVGGYLQMFTVWGLPLDSRKMIHFKLNIGDTGLYGRSYLASSLNDAEALHEMERSIAVIARNKAVPRKIISYGDPNQPASSNELDDFISYMESLEQEDDVITNKPFTMQEWAYAGGEINLDYMLNHVKKKIVAGIVPDFLAGMGDQVNRATAQTELLSYVLSIYSKREIFLKTVQNKILDPFIEKEGLKPAQVEFGELNFEGINEKNGRIMSLWTSNVLTLGQTLEQLGLPFEGKDEDVKNMRYLEYQNSHMPDMFGGGAFGGDVGDESEDPFMQPDAGMGEPAIPEKSFSFDSSKDISSEEGLNHPQQFDTSSELSTADGGALIGKELPKKVKAAPEEGCGDKKKEEISIPVEEGDTVLGGKFRNKKILVKDIGENERGEPTINGKPILNIRLAPESMHAPDDYNLDSDKDYDSFSAPSKEQVDASGTDFPHNPTGTKGLSQQYAIAIRQKFRQAYNNIMNYMEAHKQRLTESVMTEATVPIDAVESILSSLGVAVGDLAPIVEMYTGLTWKNAMSSVTKNLNLTEQLPVNYKLASAMSKSQYGWIQKYGQEKQTELRSTLTEGISQGDSITTMRNQIRDVLKTTAWRSEMIARTETIKTWNVAALESMRESGVVEKVRWITSFDERTCEQCRPLHNETWSITSKQMKVPVTDTHPNCRCSLAPAMRSESYYADLRKRDKEWVKKGGESEYDRSGKKREK